MSSVTWNDIIALRQRNSIGSLRAVVRNAYECASNDLSFAKMSVVSLEESSIGEIIEKYRPAIWKTGLEGIFSNVPTGTLVSPLSAAFGLKSFVGEIRKQR